MFPVLWKKQVMDISTWLLTSTYIKDDFVYKNQHFQWSLRNTHLNLKKEL